MGTKIKFCGAAGTVTGSCYWLQTDKAQFLVDCGLFQGTKTVKELNYRPFPFDPAKIDFVVLTHAHTDHTALVPKLIKLGFKGIVYATPATRDLLRFMLPDSGFIQEIEVKRLNRRNLQRGKASVDPIYTVQDAERAIFQCQDVDYNQWFDASDNVRFKFWNAGHILGSASVEVEIKDSDKSERLLFSGDLGPEHKLFHQGPDAPKDFDYVFCESTYGGRTRLDMTVDKRRELLAIEINDAMKAGGNLVIPSFAVERSQELLLDIAYLLKNNEIPCTSVFLDSPLAIKITSVFADHADELNNTDGGKNPFTHSRFHFTETVDESKSIARFKGGVIIMAASGMCDAGRIRHHLKEHLWRPQSTILLVGYQAEGTLGSLLESGKKNIKIQGEEMKVRARIRTLDIYSGHADNDGLVDWVLARQPIGKSIFLTHGSTKSLADMRENLLRQGVDEKLIIVPDLDDEYDLSHKDAPLKIKTGDYRLSSTTVSKPDWHNKLAQLSIDMRLALEAAPDDKRRAQILSQLQKTLNKP